MFRQLLKLFRRRPASLLKVSLFHRCFSSILLEKIITWFIRNWNIGPRWVNWFCFSFVSLVLILTYFLAKNFFSKYFNWGSQESRVPKKCYQFFQFEILLSLASKQKRTNFVTRKVLQNFEGHGHYNFSNWGK